MTTTYLPIEPREPAVSPYMLLGVASPLWTYFGAAAAGGVAYWWMTRWAHTSNLEAMFGLAAATAGEAASESLPAEPVGGEAAPMSPLVELLAEPESPPEPETPSPEPTPEPPVVAAAAPTPSEPPAEAEPAKPRLRKPAAALEADGEA
jgi:outer membrane biosynthesis protein TonB